MAYEVTVSVTPVCTSCGKDLEVGFTIGNGRLGEDTSLRLTERRFFVHACKDCFVWKGNLPEASANDQSGGEA